jgi:hypothetical protein
MGDGKRLQRQASAARDHLELVEQAGFAQSRLAHRRRHLPASADRSSSARFISSISRSRPTNRESPRRDDSCKRVRRGPVPLYTP